MYIVIVGAGKTGFALAQKLLLENKQVVLIEKDRERAVFADNNLDCQVIIDYGNNLETLHRAGVAKADFFIALTDSDEINMITCALVSSEFNHPITIARVRNNDYVQTSIGAGKGFGINYLINPEEELAKTIITAIENGARSEIMTFDSAPFQIRDLDVGADSIFKNKKVMELRPLLGESFSVTTISRDNDYIIPTGKTQILEGDTIYILATDSGFEKIFAMEGNRSRELKKILLVGGGKTGVYVADYLFHHEDALDLFPARTSKRNKKISLHIVEEDFSRCEFLSDRYPHAIVVNNDIANESFFEEENLASFDLMINLTGSPELNIMTGVYGKNLGVRRIMAMVEQNSYRRICKALEVDVVISKMNSVVSSIVKLVRKGNVRNVYGFSDSDLEAIELAIAPDSKCCNTIIKDLKLPSDILILFISRNGESFIPLGMDSLLAGDLVAFITTKSSLRTLEKLVASKK